MRAEPLPPFVSLTDNRSDTRKPMLSADIGTEKPEPDGARDVWELKQSIDVRG